MTECSILDFQKNFAIIQHVARYLETTTGRDKIMRVVQYWSRFFAYVLLRKGYSKETVRFWAQIKSTIGLSRKLFRVGKPVANLKEAITVYNKTTGDALVNVTSFLRAIGYANYLLCDSLVWLHSSKIKQLKHYETIKKVGTYFWLFGILSSIVKSLRRHQLATSRERILLSQASEKDEGELKKLAAERASANHQFVWDILDITNPLSGLDIVAFDDGVVGLAGFITGIFGVRKQWAATA